MINRRIKNRKGKLKTSSNFGDQKISIITLNVNEKMPFKRHTLLDDIKVDSVTCCLQKNAL